MNKNRKIKRSLTTSRAVGMSVMMGAGPVYAEAAQIRRMYIRKKRFMSMQMRQEIVTR